MKIIFSREDTTTKKTTKPTTCQALPWLWLQETGNKMLFAMTYQPRVLSPCEKARRKHKSWFMLWDQESFCLLSANLRHLVYNYICV